jgi:hypothetical protein
MLLESQKHIAPELAVAHFQLNRKMKLVKKSERLGMNLVLPQVGQEELVGWIYQP